MVNSCLSVALTRSFGCALYGKEVAVHGGHTGVTKSPTLGETLEVIARQYRCGQGLIGREIRVVLEQIHKVPESLAVEAFRAYGFELIEGPSGLEVSDHSFLVAPRGEED